jgi:Xaa-Pro dipeptidase
MMDLNKASKAIREEGLDGWLFLNFQHRDKIADLALGVPEQAVNTRTWVYLLLAGGDAVKIVHAIESSILDHLPGDRRVYVSRVELERELRKAAPGRGRTAAQVSRDIAAVSFLDQGHAGLLESCGFRLTTSARLIQRTLGLLDAPAMAGQRRAAAALGDVVQRVWRRIEAALGAGEELREGQVQDWILALLADKNLVSQGRPVVASGPRSGDPHYSPREGGLPLKPGAVLQLDLWAKEAGPDSVYADISWVGWLGPQVPEREQAVFATLVRAREAGLTAIAASWQSGRVPSGAEIDRRVRACLAEAGYAANLKHRTGHAIDTQVHGYGANLDSLEFPDERLLLEGSCFSIEPGLYFPEFGMRTEIDVIISGGRPVVSGPERQAALLRFGA